MNLTTLLLPSLWPVSRPAILLPKAHTPSLLSSPSTTYICLCATADSNAAPSFRRPMNDPSIDTRIHWGSSEEGWVGERTYTEVVSACEDEIESSWRSSSVLGLLINATDSHYRYLELGPDANPEEIKAAYRRLSKMYHPDTTLLPVKEAAEKFVRLREAYSVLSNVQERRSYDWKLAQEISSLESVSSTWTDLTNEAPKDNSNQFFGQEQEYEGYLDPVDRLGGQNMNLSGQAQSALAFDAFAVVVAILCITYVTVFKQPLQ